MANTKGRLSRQRRALARERLLSTGRDDVHARLAADLDSKIRRRGEWKHKTKRRMSSAQARSKSKKGKSGGGGGPAKKSKGSED